MSVDDFSTAIAIAMDPSVSSAAKQQAIDFCNQVKLRDDVWDIAIKTVNLESVSNQIKFFCFQLLDDFIRTRYHLLSPVQKSELKTNLWNWLTSHIHNPYPFFLKNKLLVLIILLFKNEYPNNWNSFFDDLFSLIRSVNKESGYEAFLQLCIIIDEEVVCQYIQRDEKDLARNTLIKDAMRINAIPLILDIWNNIFVTFHKTNTDLAVLCLKLFGLYVSWVDINAILQNGFINALVGSFASEPLRIAACDCLSNIILKGMKTSDKINLIQGLGIFNLLASLESGSDPDFDESIAKLINNVGLECSHGYDDETTTDTDRYNIINLLGSLFPFVIKYLSHEYDEITTALFPFLGAYFLLLKRLRRSNLSSIPNENLRALLEVLAVKLKYDMEVGYRVGAEAGEEEALFIEMRKNIKSHIESIAALDGDLFTSCISEVVCTTFNTFKATTERPLDFSAMNWVDAEVGLYLLYIYVEAIPGKGTPTYIDPNGNLTALGLMLSTLMECEISKYPHPSIANMYFEILLRYYYFFDQRPVYIPEALKAFLDDRGLFNPVKSIRLRVNYLFLKFIKPLRNVMGQYVESILSAVQQLLIIKPSELDRTAGRDFDSQLFLFESVGYLISVESIPGQRQSELLTIVMMPSLQRIEEIMQIGETQPLNELHISELGDLISAVGAITKGFPDYSKVSQTNFDPLVWRQPFTTTLQGILIVLSKYNVYPNIRESCRFALQRMTGCMGPELLEYIPQFLSCGLLSSETATEVIEFLPFIGLSVHKFQLSILPILVTVWRPLREKITYFLTQPPVGTDYVIELVRLRKADLTLIATLFNSQLDGVLTAPENLPELNNTLMSILGMIDEYSDPTIHKLIFSLFSKMVYCWGGAQQAVDTAIDPSSKKGMVGATKTAKAKEILRRSPLPGFDTFILEQMVPSAFAIPMNSKFNLADGLSLVTLGEIAVLHKTILSVLNQQYLEFLHNYLPTLSCPTTSVQEFITAVDQLDRKKLSKYLHTFFAKPSTAKST
ncbi:armadillo-type protein [Globomyces pollinis-pini]|nr:armadillo-type protein [Globomyces pollinis-pini]